MERRKHHRIAAANPRPRASTARTQYLTIRAMHWKPQLPEIFLGISLGMIAIEAALSSIAAVKARYRASDTFASLGMQAGNIAMNLMMAGVVYPHRLGGSPCALIAD
jgi:hypothetical protein